MAHHASSKKRIRQEAVRRLRNRYYKKTTRSAVKKLRDMKDKVDAIALLPEVTSMIDKLAKTGRIHKNKAANIVSGLSKHVGHLA